LKRGGTEESEETGPALRMVHGKRKLRSVLENVKVCIVYRASLRS
jgi:hypothetical protein